MVRHAQTSIAALLILGQGSPGAVIGPFLVPCCGLVGLLLVIGLAAALWCRRVDVDGPADGDPATGPVLPYARPRSAVRQRWDVRPAFWGVAVVATAAYVAAVAFTAHSDSDWTRTTAVLVVDAATGRPVASVDLDVVPAVENDDDAGVQLSWGQSAPGTMRVSWNRPCLLFRRPRRASDMPLAKLDDSSPATVTIRLDP